MTTLNRKNSAAQCFLPVLLIACCTLLVFCTPAAQDYGPQTGGGNGGGNGSGNSPYIVYTVSWATHLDEVIFRQAIQGISSRDKPQVYFIHDIPVYNRWLEEARKKHGFTTQPVATTWALYDLFKDKINGYVLYPTTSTEAMNYAATLAGVLDAVPVSSRMEQEAKNRNLPKLADTANFPTIESLIAQYGNVLNKKMFVNHDFRNFTLRDYGIKHKSLIVWPPNQAGLEPAYNFMDDNAVVFGAFSNGPPGYPEGYDQGGEVHGVMNASTKQVSLVPADHAMNLSFFEEISDSVHNPKPVVDRTLTPKAGEHYVAFVYTDGDNLQWIVGDFTNSNGVHGQRWPMSGRNIPMGWSLLPTLPDHGPVLLDYIYTNSPATDNFIAGLGYAYNHPSKFTAANLGEFGRLTAEYMARSGMHYVEFIDEVLTLPASHWQAILQHDQIKGVLFKARNKYREGRGYVEWHHGKPVVAYREALWSNWDMPGITEQQQNRDIYQMAYRISEYGTNYQNINAYTLVAVHAWSHAYPSIKKVVDWFTANAAHVKVVTPDTLMRFIAENVPKTSAEPNQSFNRDGTTDWLGRPRDWTYPASVRALYGE